MKYADGRMFRFLSGTATPAPIAANSRHFPRRARAFYSRHQQPSTTINNYQQLSATIDYNRRIMSLFFAVVLRRCRPVSLLHLPLLLLKETSRVQSTGTFSNISLFFPLFFQCG